MNEIMKKVGILTLLVCGCVKLYSQQLPNASFENWDILTDSSPHDDKPTDWNTINSELDAFSAGALSPTCYQSSDAHSGSYSIMLETVNPPFSGFPIVNGIATTGSINTSSYEVEGGLPYTLRPDSLVGWYKCEPETGDFPTIEFVLKDAAGDTLGHARFEGSTTDITVWTRFSVPVVYSSSATPTEAVSLLSASDGFNAVAGSKLWVDDVELIFSVGVEEESLEDLQVNYANEQLVWFTKHSVEEIKVVDLNGQLVENFTNLSTNSIPLQLTSGVYLVTFTSEVGMRTEKISVF